MIPAEYFDILGLPAFIFLLIIGIFRIRKKELPRWIDYLILVIAILGIIVDGYNVITNFLIG